MPTLKVYPVLIPNWTPPSVNDVMRAGVKDRARIKAEAYEYVGAYCCLFDVPRAMTISRSVSLTIIVAPRKEFRKDLDNIWKYLLDGLVNCGRLVDDSERWCKILPAKVVECKWSGYAPATLITLADLE